MNYSNIGNHTLNQYPYVLRGEKGNIHPTNLVSSNEVYPSVCLTPLDKQYALQNVGSIPELYCPNASGGNQLYEYSQAQVNNNTDKCVVQFQNSIQICSPRDCALGNPTADYNREWACNKMWNNCTKRRFIDNRRK